MFALEGYHSRVGNVKDLLLLSSKKINLRCRILTMVDRVLHPRTQCNRPPAVTHMLARVSAWRLLDISRLLAPPLQLNLHTRSLAVSPACKLTTHFRIQDLIVLRAAVHPPKLRRQMTHPTRETSIEPLHGEMCASRPSRGKRRHFEWPARRFEALGWRLSECGIRHHRHHEVAKLGGERLHAIPDRLE